MSIPAKDPAGVRKSTPGAGLRRAGGGLLGLALVGGFCIALAFSGCGADDQRDQNYGSDLGSGYRLPDSGTDADSTPETAAPADAGASDDSDAAAPDSADPDAVDAAVVTPPEPNDADGDGASTG